MLVFDIEPLAGMGPIRFGMPRSEVRGVLAGLSEPRAALRRPNTECYFQNAFQVSYDDSGRCEFIETAASSDFRVLFHGRCLHETAAEDAVSFVSQFAEYNKDHPELGYTYIFPNLQLAFWRAALPDDTGDAGRHFESVSVGRDGYFS